MWLWVLLIGNALAQQPVQPIKRGTAIRLHHGIQDACLCEVISVSVVRWNDKTTWKIQWANGTTDAQKQLGQTYLENFDPT